MVSGIVGYVGGAIFVTTSFLVYEDSKIPHERKEVCITMLTLFFDSGVMFASIFGFVFNSFF